jgi:Kef-type K+ transport system membrane component KefB
VTTNAIGIFSIFGLFVLGAAVSECPPLVRAVREKLRDVVDALFLPIFFTYTGLRTNVGLLDSWHLWSYCGVILAAAIIGKTGGCGLAARASGLSWRESWSVAVTFADDMIDFLESS